MRSSTRSSLRALRRLPLVATAVAGFAFTAAPDLVLAQDAADTLTQEQREANISSFDHVWETIRNNHWDPDLNGVDWEAARDELRPQVESAESIDEARRVMQRLLQKLEQSHFGIIPKETYEKFEDVNRPAEDEPRQDEEEDHTEDEESPDGWAGFEIRLREGQHLVTSVHEGSPASIAGIRPGWILESIDGTTASEMTSLAEEVSGLERAETIVALLTRNRLQGKVDGTVEVVLRDPRDQQHTIGLRLDTLPGKLASVGNLPPAPVLVETRTLESGVGYFSLNIFFDPPRVMSAFRKFLSEHKEAPGIIIDMRGNLGGVILMSSGMMNFLVDESGLKLGTMRMRDQVRGAFDYPIMLNPRGTTYGGKVAVLIDEQSISNAEILAAGLRDIGRAKLFGSRTAGLVLPSTVERLANGDGFQYAFASYVSSGGQAIEGVGVAPDTEVEANASDLSMGIDGPVAAAVKWILDSE